MPEKYKTVKRSDLEFILTEIQLLHSASQNDLSSKLDVLGLKLKDMLSGRCENESCEEIIYES